MEPQLHVAMLPWSAFGHMIPFLELSLALAKAGVRVTNVSTPRNIQRLPQIPPTLAKLVKFEEVPMPKVEGLPEEAEATIDVTFEQIELLKIAYDLLEEPFTQIVANQSPDWIIMDFASFWASNIVEKYGVSHMWFSVFNAASCAFFGAPEFLVGEQQRRFRSNPVDLTTKPPWIQFPSRVAYRGYEARGAHAGYYGKNASGTSDAERVAKILKECEVMVVRSCKEFEGDYIDLFESLIEKPFIPIGLLPPERKNNAQKLDGPWREVFGWLDEQSCESVVFVGFGSECKLAKEEVYEIAYGLEMSKLPFIWALRRPVWASNDVEALPEGFKDRVAGKGIVCLEWAPQQEILGHPSVGGCLFHSGRGSVIESLQYGHRLVVLPFIIDQGLNARLLGDKGLAIEVERREDGSFIRDDIARALTRAMVEEEGEKIKGNARDMAQVFADTKLHDSYIDRLIVYMKDKKHLHVRK